MEEGKSPVTQPDQEKDSADAPHVFAVSKNGSQVKFTRRDFLQVATVSAASVVLASCVPETPVEPTPLPTDPPTLTPTITPTDTPTPSQTPSLTPIPTVMCTAKSSANVRFGPSTSSQVIGSLATGDKVQVIGRNPDGTWARIEKPGGLSGWLKASLLSIPCEIQDLQVMTPLPTSTPLPGRAGKTAPGQKGVDYNYKDPVTGITYQYTLPCGAAIPPGAVCVCNCVTVPAGCSCDAYKAPKPSKPCKCDTVCTCDSVCTCDGAGHYWYPN